MTEDKVALTEYRPHTAVIITIGFNSMTLFVEEPIDQIKTVLERIKNQEYFTLNVAMQKHRNYVLWDPECDDDEKVISGLLKMFMKEANIVIPDYQYPVIMRSLLNLGQSNAIDLMYTVIDKVSRGGVQNPLGYLMVSITSASVPKPQGGEINGTN